MSIKKRVEDLEAETPQAPITEVPFFTYWRGNFYDMDGNLANDKAEERTRELEKCGANNKWHSIINMRPDDCEHMIKKYGDNAETE